MTQFSMIIAKSGLKELITYFILWTWCYRINVYNYWIERVEQNEDKASTEEGNNNFILNNNTKSSCFTTFFAEVRSNFIFFLRYTCIHVLYVHENVRGLKYLKKNLINVDANDGFMKMKIGSVISI